MAGSLEKRGDNSWRMVYFKGRDEDGRRNRYTRNFKGTKSQAEKALAKFVTDIENGLVGDGENMLFSDLCERWMTEYAKEHLSPKTILDYQKIIERRLKPTFGQFKLFNIKPLNITKFYRELKNPEKRLDGRTKDGLARPLSGATIQKYHRVLSSIFSTAVRWQLIASNPCLRVEVPKNPHEETSFYDEQQILKLFKALEGEQSKYRTLILLATLSGLRRGEIVALTWDDIDFDKGTLTVSKQAQYIKKGEGIVIRKPKTKSSLRTIALPLAAINALKEHKRSQNEERLKIGDLWKKGNYLFTTWDGAIMHPDTPSSWFNDFLKENNLPHIRFHDLRHTSATILLGSGVPLKNVSARLGHSSASITANIYAHALESVDRQAADKLDQLMKKG